MKNLIHTTTAKFALVLFVTTLFSLNSNAQTDTLHLYYKGLDIKMPDTTEAKITAWVKKLNGKRVDVNVYAYYAESEFKKFSAERADELFLVLNRKARSLITLQSYGPKKGKKSQRSVVDIVYTYNGSSAPVANSTGKTGTGKTGTGATGTTSATNNSANTSAAEAEAESDPNTFVAREQFKKRKLMIVLLEESKEQIEKLMQKPEEQQTYRENVKKHNENITKAFTTFWKLSPVGFVKESELAAAGFDEKALNWVLLLPGKKEINNIPFMTYNLTMVYKESSAKYVSDATFKVSLRTEMPTEADYLLLMHKMKVYYNAEKEFNMEQLEETLGKKTLYVDSDITDMTKEEFREGYPYPFEYKTAEEVREKTNKGDKDAAYLKLDVYDGALNAMIVDAGTGVIMSRAEMSGISAPAVKESFSVENKITNGNIAYSKCFDCPNSASPLIINFNVKAKIKKGTLKNLADEKKQIKTSDPLTIY